MHVIATCSTLWLKRNPCSGCDSSLSRCRRRLTVGLQWVPAQVLKTDLLQHLLPQLPALDFECRKDISQVFSNLLRKQIDGGQPADPLWWLVQQSYPADLRCPSLAGEHLVVVWLEAHPEALSILLQGYAQPEVALHYGAMLRVRPRPR